MSDGRRQWVGGAVGASLTAMLVLGYELGRARADGIPTTETMYFGATIDEGGVPVSGSRDVRVRLYDAATAGTLLCDTDARATPVVTGRLRVPLAATCTAEVQRTPDAWVELSVGGAVVGGRTKLGAVPYAVEAQRANDLTVAAAARLREAVYRAVQGDPANSTGGWDDLPGTRIAFTLASARDVDILASGQVSSVGNTSNTACEFRFVLDDVPVDTGYAIRRTDVPAAGMVMHWGALWSWSALAAGAHTIRTQIHKVSPAATNCTTAGTRVLVTVR